MDRVSMWDSNGRPLAARCDECGETAGWDVHVLVHGDQVVGIELECLENGHLRLFAQVDSA